MGRASTLRSRGSGARSRRSALSPRQGTRSVSSPETYPIAGEIGTKYEALPRVRPAASLQDEQGDPRRDAQAPYHHPDGGGGALPSRFRVELVDTVPFFRRTRRWAVVITSIGVVSCSEIGNEKARAHSQSDHTDAERPVGDRRLGEEATALGGRSSGCLGSRRLGGSECGRRCGARRAPERRRR